MKKDRSAKEINWLLAEKYNGELHKSAKQDIARLKTGEPLEYVLGHTRFLGSIIDVSLWPLIPRPETEYWVGRAIEEIKNAAHIRTIRCLDLFSGSGCIGIALLKAAPRAKVDFADISKRCLKQIRLNLQVNNIHPKRYRIIRSNIFSNITSKYDFILANPPYIPTAKKIRVQKSVLKFEPKSALFGGKDGLLYIRKFLSRAFYYCLPQGKLYVEFDPPQKQEIEKFLNRFGYHQWQFFKDQYGEWRYLVADAQRRHEEFSIFKKSKSVEIQFL